MAEPDAMTFWSHVRQEDMRALARVASVAAVIEPPLLRRLRRGVPGLVSARGTVLPAGVEADLWFSDSAHVATSSQLTLRPEVLLEMRRELATERYRTMAEAARAIVVDAHRSHSEMVRLEERIIWSTIIDDIDDVGLALQRVIATVRLGPDEAADAIRWFGQARRRLPPSVLEHPVGRRLLAAVAMHLDRVIPPELLAANRFPDAVADMAPSRLPATTVGVTLVSGGVRFVPPDEPSAAALQLPDTRPLVLEATWAGPEGEERTAVIRAEPHSAAALDGLAGEVALRTVAGNRYRVTSATARLVVVGVVGKEIPAELFRRIETTLGHDTLVRVVSNPSDLYGQPEVLVVGARLDRSVRKALDELVPAFVRAAGRAHDPGLSPAPPGALVLQLDVGRYALPDRLRDLVEQRGLPILSSWGPIDLDDVLLAAVRTVVGHPERLYRLNVETALTMLQSVALAFHVGSFYRDEAPSDREVARLFDLPEPSGDWIEADDAASATYVHVKHHCEWIFAGPVRDYLAGGEDPTRTSTDAETSYHEGLRDAMGRTAHDLGWSASGTPWPSFAAYLTWFLQELQRFARLARDRLGPGLRENGYAVPTDALEAARLALGVAALPLGHDRVIASSASEDRMVYAVERAGLPRLIAGLAAPVTAALEAESAARESRARHRPAGRSAGGDPDLTVTITSGRGDRSPTWSCQSPLIEASRDLSITGPAFDRAEIRQSFDRERLSSDRIFDLTKSASGQLISQAMPRALAPLIHEIGEAAGRPPTMLLIDEWPPLPWELAYLDSAIDSRDPPFLGCQTAIGRWPAASSRPVEVREAPADAQMAVIAPRYGERGLPSLPGAEEEAAELVQRYRGRRVDGNLASVRELLAEGAFDILHFSGHGGPSTDDQPGLVLDDGFLPAAELLRMASSSASLIFLSTDGSVGMADAMATARASAVVTPMTGVTDLMARQVALAFYAGILDRGLPGAEALRSLRAAGGALGAAAHRYQYWGHPSMSFGTRGLARTR